MTATLFEAFSLRQLTLPNRIVIAPMCQYSATHGVIGDWHRMHLGNLSHSGAGLLIIEATAVAPEGRISDRCPGLWNEEQEHAFASVLRAVRAHSRMPIAIQLAHAGRKASCAVPWGGGTQLSLAQGGWSTVAPSANVFRATDRLPNALDDAGLQRIRQAFTDAAVRADRLGIDAIELHAAHGYLLHQFMSPLANQRTDAYGGTLQNRLRFPLEIFDTVRAVWPAHKPLGMRVSATDWVTSGWNLEDTLVLAHALKERGADFIHVSSGGQSLAQQITAGPGYQVPFARAIKAETGLTTIAVGEITEARQAEQILHAGDADLIALARGLLYNPRWPWHAAAELGAQVEVPPQFWRGDLSAQGRLFKKQGG